MSKLFGKLGEMIFGSDEELEEFEDDTEDTLQPLKNDLKPAGIKRSPGKVVNIHATTQLEVAVLQPQCYEDAREIADRLKAKRAVVVNLEKLDIDDAVKALDFISGAVYALEGEIQKVSNGIFLIAPYNVTISSDVKNELKNKGVFPWSF